MKLIASQSLKSRVQVMEDRAGDLLTDVEKTLSRANSRLTRVEDQLREVRQHLSQWRGNHRTR